MSNYARPLFRGFKDSVVMNYSRTMSRYQMRTDQQKLNSEGLGPIYKSRYKGVITNDMLILVNIKAIQIASPINLRILDHIIQPARIVKSDH